MTLLPFILFACLGQAQAASADTSVLLLRVQGIPTPLRIPYKSFDLKASHVQTSRSFSDEIGSAIGDPVHLIFHFAVRTEDEATYRVELNKGRGIVALLARETSPLDPGHVSFAEYRANDAVVANLSFSGRADERKADLDITCSRVGIKKGDAKSS